MLKFTWGDGQEQFDYEAHREKLCELVSAYTITTYSHEVVGWLMSADFFKMTKPAIDKAAKRNKIKPHFFLMCDGTVDHKTVKPILSIPSNRYIIN